MPVRDEKKEKKPIKLFFAEMKIFFVSFQLVQESGRHGSEPEIVLQNLRPCSRWTSHPPGCSRSSRTHGSWNRPSDLAVVRLLRWPVKPTRQLGRIVYKAKKLTDHLFLILLRFHWGLIASQTPTSAENGELIWTLLIHVELEPV